MILERKTFSLNGKEVFHKVVIKAPFDLSDQMVNEACFLYVLEGDHVEVSEDEILSITKGESILKKCGNYLSRANLVKKDSMHHVITIHFYPEILKVIYADEFPDFLKQPEGRLLVPNMTKVRGSLLIEKYFESLLLYFENQELVDDEFLKLKLKELILLLVKTQNSTSFKSIYPQNI